MVKYKLAMCKILTSLLLFKIIIISSKVFFFWWLSWWGQKYQECHKCVPNLQQCKLSLIYFTILKMFSTYWKQRPCAISQIFVRCRLCNSRVGIQSSNPHLVYCIHFCLEKGRHGNTLGYLTLDDSQSRRTTLNPKLQRKQEKNDFIIFLNNVNL